MVKICTLMGLIFAMINFPKFATLSPRKKFQEVNSRKQVSAKKEKQLIRKYKYLQNMSIWLICEN